MGDDPYREPAFRDDTDRKPLWVIVVECVLMAGLASPLLVVAWLLSSSPSHLSPVLFLAGWLFAFISLIAVIVSISRWR